MGHGKVGETIIDAGDWLYVLGQVRVEEGRATFNNTHGDLIIAKSRHALLRHLRRKMLCWISLVIILVAIGVCASYGFITSL